MKSNIEGKLPEIQCSSDDGSYSISIKIETSCQTAELRNKLQAAYDEGVSGFFEIKDIDAHAKHIVFDRQIGEDYEMLAERMGKGSVASRAACEQLADEFSELQREAGSLATVIVALRDPNTAVVTGLVDEPREPPVHEYAFDCTLTTVIRVKGTTREEAEAHLRAAMDAASCNGGAWPNGDPIVFEASVDGSTLALYEVDGEPVGDGNLQRVPSEDESAALKQRFKAHFEATGIDSRLPSALAIANAKYPLEWDEACREFETEGKSPAVGPRAPTFEMTPAEKVQQEGVTATFRSVAESAAGAFWEQIVLGFPEMTTGDSLLSGEDEGAMYLWLTGEAGNYPMNECLDSAPACVDASRIAAVNEAGIQAAANVLRQSKPDLREVPDAVRSLLEGCVRHQLRWNFPSEEQAED